MAPSSFVNLNGQILPAAEASPGIGNSAFRQGLGVFETIRVVDGRWPLAALHFERLTAGMAALGFAAAATLRLEKIRQEILALCERNAVLDAARVRLSIFMDDLVQGALGWLIEAVPFQQTALVAGKGLTIGVFPDGRKAIDRFSPLKSNNYLVYAMAAAYARANALDDCIVLNSFDRVGDTSIANLFCIKNNTIFTPPLSEGPVAGVMRRWLHEKNNTKGYVFREMAMDLQFLEDADEVFLTNALRGLRPVQFFRGKEYGMETGTKLAGLVENMFSGKSSPEGSGRGKKIP